MTTTVRNTGKILIRIFLGTHIWLGLCAVSCTAGTYMLLGLPIQPLYMLFVFFGTMTIYNLHTYFTTRIKGKNPTTFLSLPFLKIVLSSGLLITAVLYSILTLQNKLLLLLPSVLALLYVLPVFRGKRLKDFSFIKIGIITLVWTTITLGIPLWHIPQWWTHGEYSLLLADRLLFIFVLAIPFDVRDIHHDTAVRLKTLPNTLGLRKSQNLALFLLGISLLLLTASLRGILPDLLHRPYLPALYFLLAFLILRLQKFRSDFYYQFFLDGILFLYGAALFLSLL